MPNLNSPIEVKGLKIKNRLVLPPIATDTCVEGRPTEKTFENYKSYASCGVGTIIIEHNYIDVSGKLSTGQMGIDSADFQPERNRLAEEIHTYDVVTGVQITHAGSATKTSLTGVPLYGPSAVQHPVSGEIPQELSTSEIKGVIAKFVEAANLVKSAGFDFVELHAAHTYLLNQFYSPLTNLREDEYGGTPEKRLRLLLEVTQAVRKALGNDYPIFMRFGAVDMLEGGTTSQDAAFAAPRLAEAGVDVLDISGGMCGSRPQGMLQGHFVPAAVAVKRVVNIPIIVTGGITQPQFADALIREGKTDFVGIARALMKDKAWVKEALAAI